MTEFENKAVERRFIDEVLNQGRFEVAEEIVAEDFIELDPLPGQRQGREGLVEVLRGMLTAFPDIHWIVEEMIAEGDKVVTRFTWTGTHSGPFLGIPATGNGVTVKGLVIDRIVTGKITDSRILMDTMAMMQQLGVLPSA